MGSKNDVFLASYPKSGNTWFRAFIGALNSKEFSLDKIQTDGIFSSKSYLTDLGVLTDYLSKEQAICYQRTAFEYHLKKYSSQKFIKVHDAYTYSSYDGLPSIPAFCIKKAIYIIRNPLDVVLSLSNHTGLGYQQIIDEYINNPHANFPENKRQFCQPLLTWSQHAESWLQQQNISISVIRYEDMKERTFETFKKALQFANVACDDRDIEIAIEQTQFEKLKTNEEQAGFIERSKKTPSFFFHGKVGRWRKELTAAQIQQVKITNEDMMREFDYWED